MRNRYKHAWVTVRLLLLAIGLLSIQAEAQNCNEVLQYGVFDTTEVQDESQVITTFFNWVKQQSFGSTQNARDRGFNIEAIVSGVPIMLGGHDKTSNFQAWMNAMESWVKQTGERRSRFSSKIKSANPNIIAAWEKCMSTPGFKLSLHSTYDPHEFTLKLKFNPIGSLVTATLDEVPSIPPSISCRPSSLQKGLEINHNGKEYLCTRSSDAAATISLNSTAGSQRVAIRAILPPPTPVSVNLSLSSESNTASGHYPIAQSTTSNPRRIRVGGGCAVSHHREGSEHALVMVHSKPIDFGWECKAADPPNMVVIGSATSTAIFAEVYTSRPSVRLESTTRSQTSERRTYPEITIRLNESEIEQGYVVVSGGCTSGHARGNGADHATPIVKSYPTEDMQGWTCKGADPPDISLVTTVTAYLVAARLVDTSPSPQFVLPRLESKLFVGQEARGMYPLSEVAVEDGFILSGGGCNVSYAGNGSAHAEFAVTNTLRNKKWVCWGADPPFRYNSATARSFAIGLRIAP